MEVGEVGEVDRGVEHDTGEVARHVGAGLPGFEFGTGGTGDAIEMGVDAV